MKSALTLLLASILLFACSDSKKNTQEDENLNVSMMSREVASEYQIIDLQAGQQAECLFSLDDKAAGKLLLHSKQQVTLADLKETVTVTKDGISWLAVHTDTQPEQICYIQTRYLEPVPIN